MLLRDGYARNSHGAAGTTIVLTGHIEGGGVLGTMAMKPVMMVILVLLFGGPGSFFGGFLDFVASINGASPPPIPPRGPPLVL